MRVKRDSLRNRPMQWNDWSDDRAAARTPRPDPYPPAAHTAHWPFLVGLSGYRGTWRPRSPVLVAQDVKAALVREAVAEHAKRAERRQPIPIIAAVFGKKKKHDAAFRKKRDASFEAARIRSQEVEVARSQALVPCVRETTGNCPCLECNKRCVEDGYDALALDEYRAQETEEP